MDDEPSRPDPDELLARVQAEERRRSRGSLRIFLGFAAGVGKTYAMLEAAHQRQVEGVDVVVACVDTHGRAETEALLQGLELVAQRRVPYHGVVLSEMDVDVLLERAPALAIVDELAHTNAPGSRHAKRHHDVEELLQAGIDVYTTMNVQHVESLNDVVAQITGVKVRETVPDGVLDSAEVELVDLTPEELLLRLQEGKVYVPEQAAQAVRRFFRLGNLTALRELAMRRAAERVDDQMQAYMRARAIPGPWPAAERVLVCVSSGPMAGRLVRAGRRFAEQIGAAWSVVYFETYEHTRLPRSDQDRIAATLRLAEDLGAGVATLPARAVAEAVLDYARRHNFTKVIVGRPVRPRWRDMIRGSPVDRIIRESGAIDVYVVSGAVEPEPEPVAGAFPQAQRSRVRDWRPFAKALVLVAGATALGAALYPVLSPANLVMPYLLAVVIAATYLGRGPSVLCAVAGVLAFDVFLVPPRLQLAVSDTQYVLTFAALLVVSLVISELTLRVRHQAAVAEQRASQNAELYAISRELAGAGDVDTVARTMVMRTREALASEAVLLVPEGSQGPLRAHPPESNRPPDDELAVASWVQRHGRGAGRGTQTLAGAAAQYLPLEASGRVVGVLGVSDPVASSPSLEDRRQLEAYASQAAVAIDRATLAAQARQVEMLAAAERLQTALLNSISHDLRTPLVAITGALSVLSEEDDELQSMSRRALIENALGEAVRLNRLVGNLVDMTRIEAGALRARPRPSSVEDVVNAGTAPLADRLSGRPVELSVSPEVAIVPMDEVLMAQVILNLVDNAVKHSPPGTPIEIRARREDSNALIEVADRGIGIPAADLMLVFDKLYRVRRPGRVEGMGLGLSICRGIVEAHGGSIEARARDGGGTIVALRLPLEPEAGLVLPSPERPDRSPTA